jgi:hypothetical protein
LAALNESIATIKRYDFKRSPRGVANAWPGNGLTAKSGSFVQGKEKKKIEEE